jgi:hypothetical protein
MLMALGGEAIPPEKIKVYSRVIPLILTQGKTLLQASDYVQSDILLGSSLVSWA